MTISIPYTAVAALKHDFVPCPSILDLVPDFHIHPLYMSFIEIKTLPLQPSMPDRESIKSPTSIMASAEAIFVPTHESNMTLSAPSVPSSIAASQEAPFITTHKSNVTSSAPLVSSSNVSPPSTGSITQDSTSSTAPKATKKMEKKKYKPVALKVKPIIGKLPDKFHIIRNIIGDLLKELPSLNTHPPPF